MSGFDSFPSLGQQFVGICPFFKMMLHKVTVFIEIAEVFLCVDYSSEKLVFHGMSTQFYHIFS